MFRMLNNSPKRRTARIIPFIVLALLFYFLFTTPLYAMLVGAGRFDRLIQNAKIIVKAQVIPIDESPFGMIAFKAEIIEVLKIDGGPIPDNLLLKSAIFIWPNDMGVPFEEKQVVLLVLRRVKDKLVVKNHMRSILPATTSKIRHENHSTITRKVFGELHAFLPQAKDQIAQGLVLVHLSHLGSKADENVFLPYMESKNKRLRRAALASLLRLNPTSERMRAAVADFNDHLCTPFKPSRDHRILVGGQEVFMPPKDQLFWEMYQDVQWASRCGAWGMEKNMTARAKAYLPIYRVLIDKAPPDYQRVYIAIKGLKNVGTREDIRRLYKYVDSEKAWIRRDVFEGLGRILDMKIKRLLITSYMIPFPSNMIPFPSNAESWEKEFRSIVEKALANESLLGK